MQRDRNRPGNKRSGAKRSPSSGDPERKSGPRSTARPGKTTKFSGKQERSPRGSSDDKREVRGGSTRKSTDDKKKAYPRGEAPRFAAEKKWVRKEGDGPDTGKRRERNEGDRRGPRADKDRTSDRRTASPRRADEEKSRSRPSGRTPSGKRAPSRAAGRKKVEAPPITGDEKIRLNRYIANSGVCSRREADELIRMGLITVNGNTVSELGYKVDRKDVVRHEGKLLRAEKPVYVLLNKPKGFLTTTKDPQERNTVMALLGGTIKERIYPVGRLDRNTTGLLLLTNDGDLADRLSHPSYEVKKIYKAELDRPLTKADAERVMQGIRLEEGVASLDDFAVLSEDRKTVGLELHIGWNRVVRRIFEALNYEVVKLDRTVYAGLDKKDLPRGTWRFLRPEEVVKLKHFR